ncbi:hypothetical protein OAL14_04775 [Gammaproteobacteria bacterium]|nr:hypothetical protein [Gammaproteobacteria bacterium]
MSRRSLILNIILICFSTTLHGCYFSFRSNQLSALSSAYKVIFEENRSTGLEKSWVLSWDSSSLAVLPMNVGKEIWFVGEGDVVVQFDGWQIIGVSNVLPGNTLATSQFTDSILRMFSNTRIIREYQCESWSSEFDPTEQLTILTQRCSDEEDKINNIILLDQYNSIVDLLFFVHPNYPPINLRRQY